MRRDADQWKQLYGATHIHSSGGRPTRGGAGGDFLDARSCSCPGSCQRHRASRFRNRNQPGANDSSRSRFWGKPALRRLRRSQTPATLQQPASRFLCRRRSASLRTPAAPCWGPAPVAPWEWCLRPVQTELLRAPSRSAHPCSSSPPPRPSPESAALPVQFKCSPFLSAFRRRELAAPVRQWA